MTVDFESLGYHKTPAGVWARDETPEFGYSDGDETETWLAQVIRSAPDISTGSDDLAAQIVDWPSLYHLSPARGNLFHPLLPVLEGPVLELGAGMGAITRVLGESGLEIVSVEGSRRRAEICAQRTRDLPNVSVVADTIQGFGRPATFPTVLLIGVLEYARVFGLDTDGVDPVDVLLDHAAALVGDRGQLVVAIENQLGLKYLAGFREDHVGRRMVGVEGLYGATTPVTFGRTELAQRLDRAGLVHRQWYYPFPDYKLPNVVLTHRAFDPASGFDPGPLIVATAHGDGQEPAVTTFDPELAYDAVLRNGLMPALSNSFLVRASASPVPEPEELGWYFGPTVVSAAKRLTFVAHDGAVDVRTHRRATGTEVSHPYAAGRPWSETVRRIVAVDGWGLADLEPWFRFWARSVGQFFGEERLEAHTVLPPEALDAIPRNLMVHEGSGTFIDLDWRVSHPLTFGFLTFRALLWTLLPIRWRGEAAEGTPTTVGQLMVALAPVSGVELDSTALEHYWQTEHAFQADVVGHPPDGRLSQFLDITIPVRRTIDDIVAVFEQDTDVMQALREERDDLLLSLDARDGLLRSQPSVFLPRLRAWKRQVQNPRARRR
ncbi:MAG: hypothetical protein FWH11_04215 [Micrococcales bacterium]|nr:hypothetical protein [Micrococcales bacterium]